MNLPQPNARLGISVIIFIGAVTSVLFVTLSGEHLNHAFPETQSYVTQGLKTYARYQALYRSELARVAPKAIVPTRVQVVK